jgi:hypothetical protein
MIEVRTLVILSCVGLGGCSPNLDDIGTPRYVPPSPPSPAVQLHGAKAAVEEEHLTGAIEISDVRPSDHGPGRFVICMRGARAEMPPQYYAVFFTNDEYKGSRLSVIYDFCEQQSYRPLVSQSG